MSQISFHLKPLPPFRLDLTVWVLRRRPENLWDRWDGQTYRRVLVMEGKVLELAVTQTGSPHEPDLEIMATGVRLKPEIKAPLTTTLVRVLGLQTDLTDFYRLALKDSKLTPLVNKF